MVAAQVMGNNVAITVAGSYGQFEVGLLLYLAVLLNFIRGRTAQRL